MSDPVSDERLEELAARLESGDPLGGHILTRVLCRESASALRETICLRAQVKAVREALAAWENNGGSDCQYCDDAAGVGLLFTVRELLSPDAPATPETLEGDAECKPSRHAYPDGRAGTICYCGERRILNSVGASLTTTSNVPETEGDPA